MLSYYEIPGSDYATPPAAAMKRKGPSSGGGLLSPVPQDTATPTAAGEVGDCPTNDAIILCGYNNVMGSSGNGNFDNYNNNNNTGASSLIIFNSSDHTGGDNNSFLNFNTNNNSSNNNGQWWHSSPATSSRQQQRLGGRGERRWRLGWRHDGGSIAEDGNNNSNWQVVPKLLDHPSRDKLCRMICRLDYNYNALWDAAAAAAAAAAATGERSTSDGIIERNGNDDGGLGVCQLQ